MLFSDEYRARGIVCRTYNGDTSFSELDAGEGLITTATVAECSSGLLSMKLRLYPFLLKGR